MKEISGLSDKNYLNKQHLILSQPEINAPRIGLDVDKIFEPTQKFSLSTRVVKKRIHTLIEKIICIIVRIVLIQGTITINVLVHLQQVFKLQITILQTL